MADPVVQTTAAGASVAVDLVGSRNFQLVKLEAGSTSMKVPIDATSGIPAASSMGIVVAQKAGASVTVVAAPAVSGTVTVNGTVAVPAGLSVSAVVSGTVSISGPPQVNGTITVNTQTVGNLPTVDVTTTGIPAASSTGFIVALKAGATVLGASALGSSGRQGTRSWCT